MVLWCPIRTFPRYSVSDHGQVRNDDTGRSLAMMRNQHGVVHVGLSRGKIQYKRSVSVLVAQTFLPPPPEAFDTPINLDGDRGHNHIDNLIWRPRWFAVKYHRQFEDEEALGIWGPIEEIETGEQFKTSWDATTAYGLIHVHLKLAILNEKRVWPTQQLYRRL